MRENQLYVIAVYANPMQWKSRLRLYEQFETHMLESGVHLITVECAYGDRPYEIHDSDCDEFRTVRVRARTLVWNKENLINIGLSRLPDDAKYVAWIDADIAFRDYYWAKKTVEALQLVDVVQPWETAFDLGPNCELMQTATSFASQWAKGYPVVDFRSPGNWNLPYAFPHPGYAWAARRDFLDRTGGVYENCAIGAGDHHMAYAMVGAAELSVSPDAPHAYREDVVRWQRRAALPLLGYVPGTIEHYFHGRKSDRGYRTRWQMQIEHQFDPQNDLVKNTYGVIELAGTKPKLALDLQRYFASRNEDRDTL